ncbi:2-amino-4-hydroxy-6-hydroxymethyldihydropteridine diphosphokinase [Methylotenera versatilis]|uniref:2-amino-4-hydroxy-6-hydroxymethyldihydropteridine pyrophosphokinase n=1 Tax=Methylotenera versatilis (strain 301) TaxID=666681 RepID=D7DL53_METV0|nr:2-amino-4-hydroxy-6-hydroxymethyldihydropteridine diphosphokinase [Methylotenera versatilis]ADI30524.1 2-amino-4-hydroxy-6-hydroxymethyldihydropteridine pyrophosphokinase [Methylotenera versatilis 301]
MKQAFVALGSNLANPISQVESAFAALENLPNTRVIKKSSLYKTAPIGYEAEQLNQIPDFINAVAELETDLAPLELLDALLEIENQAGRERPFPNAPRVLDCDLLLYENVSMESTKLILPHPRMHQRGFVLLPLFEIAAQLSIPNHGKIATLIHEQQFTGITKL